MSFFFHWKWKWHEKGKNCFKGNMVKSELCWILFDKMKLRRNRNYVENEFSCGECWNNVVYFFLYKCKIKAFREYDISFIRKNAKSRDFSHHEFSVNELKSLEYRDCDIFSFFPIRAIRMLLANQWEGMDYDFMVYPCPEWGVGVRKIMQIK